MHVSPVTYFLSFSAAAGPPRLTRRRHYAPTHPHDNLVMLHLCHVSHLSEELDPYLHVQMAAILSSAADPVLVKKNEVITTLSVISLLLLRTTISFHLQAGHQPIHNTMMRTINLITYTGQSMDDMQKEQGHNVHNRIASSWVYILHTSSHGSALKRINSTSST